MSAISVVVVNWNRRGLLASCLRSLAAQRGADFEVIVVDNGSTDGSVEMIEAEFEPDPRLRLRLIRNRENRGFCGANNQGFAASRSRLIALLNNDAEAAPDWLRSLAGVFEGRPEIGLAASKILVWEDRTRIDKVGHLIYPDGQNRGRGTGQRDNGQFDRVEEVLWPDGCAAMYRREVIDCVGGFDEDFFAYADDAEFGLRARIAGWKCLYVPEAVVWHHRSATLGVASTRKLELIERNRVLLVTKLFPWSLLWLNVAYYMARICAGLKAGATDTGEMRRFPGWRGKLRVAKALASGDLQALRLLPKMLRKRRDIERYRKLNPRQVRELLLRNRISLEELSEQAT